jgi:Uncharacterized conserved protein
MLLSKNKIEIRDIQISRLLEQYLEFISDMQELDLEIASEFVQMASHLVYIKTRMLLPREEDEVSELDELMDSLEKIKHRDSYVQIKSVTDEFEKSLEVGTRMLSKYPETFKKSREYVYMHDSIELLSAFQSIALRAAALPDDRTGEAIPKPITYGVRDKSRQLIENMRLAEHGVLLMDLYGMCKSRTELVATFISVLELCSMGSLCLRPEEEGGSLRAWFMGDGDVEAILGAISD